MIFNQLKILSVCLGVPATLEGISTKNGLKPAHLRALWAIRAMMGHWGTTVTIAELYASGLQAPTRLRACVSALVAKGFVSRHRCRPRQHLLRLTPKGERLLQDSVMRLQEQAWR
ncbi:hypothetical protein CDA63_09025 [Hymenobacter amundsenii]|uniref:HTH marR-type domain-containing protein n=1 Tax=Hymenobacter amundsenii TaxID=2006685 RepID=A0A246FL93_9BACT|nr:hypothetical protein CDA63_09025 [Hymenobacter amundsenii]